MYFLRESRSQICKFRIKTKIKVKVNLFFIYLTGLRLCVVLVYVVFVFSNACFINFLATLVSSGEGVAGGEGRGKLAAAVCKQSNNYYFEK